MFVLPFFSIANFVNLVLNSKEESPTSAVFALKGCGYVEITKITT